MLVIEIMNTFHGFLSYIPLILFLFILFQMKCLQRIYEKVPVKIQRICFGILATVALLPFILYHQNIDVRQLFMNAKQDRLQPMHESSKVKQISTILLYNAKHWEKAIWESYSNKSFWENCPFTCRITTDQKLYNESDAVIFVIDLLGGRTLPKKLPKQVWIFAQYESTNYLMKEIHSKFVTSSNLKNYNNKVNWTISYRRDSDFPFIHGSYSVRQKKFEDASLSKFKSFKKKNGTAWFVSHCGTSSKRENYVNLLRKHLSVHIYGACGKMKVPSNCPKSRELAIRECWGLAKSKCFDILDEKYLFYLSFENALCRDYVTEKGLHHVTQHNIIPVMRGSANYSLFNPPTSYIDTKDFSSPKQLAKYLHSIETDAKLQSQFQKWKREYVSSYPRENWRRNMCNICQRLNDPVKYMRVYNDIYKWIVTPNNQPGCWLPSDLH